MSLQNVCGCVYTVLVVADVITVTDLFWVSFWAALQDYIWVSTFGLDESSELTFCMPARYFMGFRDICLYPYLCLFYKY